MSIRKPTGLKLCFWGTYDTGKPRVRILHAGLRENLDQVAEQHIGLWKGVEDKSQAGGATAVLRFLGKMLLAWPRLWLRHAVSARYDIVICAYPGNLDVLILWALARVKKEWIALDAFVPVHDTVVHDRGILRPGFAAAIVHFIEWLACQAADIIIVDTKAHGEYFISEFEVDRRKIVRAFVGCEPEFFHSQMGASKSWAGGKHIVLFYGQFIPLHGIDTIIEAAKICSNTEICWRIIGTGQEAGRVREMLKKAPLDNVDWVPWVEYAQLRDEIECASVCLGIFGTSAKAARVIPNKVFQIVACGKPIVTRDSPAIRELFADSPPGLYLVPPGDPEALCSAVMEAVASNSLAEYGKDVLDAISPGCIGAGLIRDLERIVGAVKSPPDLPSAPGERSARRAESNVAIRGQDR